MLVLLFVIHLLSARALPVQVAAVDEANTSPACKDIDNCRTLLGIIWSCLTTILLCTWVAIHPNVPAPVDTRGKSLRDKCMHKLSSFFRDKVVLFLWALLVPEYILAWAIRQHLWAMYIVTSFPDLELTQTHAFFMIMGGFHYCEGSDKAGEPYQPVHPLTYTNVATMLRKKTVMFPTEQELQNQSKSDWIANQSSFSRHSGSWRSASQDVWRIYRRLNWKSWH